jgi:F-type H+-transporting ATPase subunit b
MRVGMAVGLALFVLVLAAPAASAADGLLFAAAPPAEKGGEHEGDLDVFKGGVELTIWSIVVFLILFALLSKFAWPQIREGLDKREQAIARDKHEADLARAEAGKLRSDLERQRAAIQDEIRQMMDKARSDAQQLAAEEQARTKAELAAERDRLHRELRISTDDALHKLWGQTVGLAALISGKVIGKQLSVEDHRALLDEALAEFRGSAQARREDIEGARG